MAFANDLLAALERRHRPWDLTVAGVLAALTFAVLRPPIRLNHDCALLLEIGGQLLDGARPYVDYLETNPPYVHYLFAVPAGVARVLGTPVGSTFQLLVVAAVVASVLACRVVLARSGAPPMARGLVLLALAAHALVVAGGGDFGQKDHLFFLATIPWLLQLALGPVGAARAFALGFVAALGAQVKPHYVLADLAWLLSLAVVRREPRLAFDPAVLGFVCGGIAYPLLLLGLPAESWTALTTWYLPFVARGYAAYDSAWIDVIGISALPMVLYAAAVAGSLRGERRLVLPLALFLGWGVVAYFAQGKGFVYHRVPLLGTSALLAAIGVYAWHRTDRPVGLSAWLVWVAAALMLAGRAAVSAPAPDPLFELVATRTVPGDRVLWIDTAVPPEWPGMLESGLRPAGRYLPAFPIAMLYHGTSGRYRSPEEAPPEERRYMAELADDLRRWEPPVVVVNHQGECKACPEGFDILELLEHNGFVGRELAGYERLGEVDGRVVFARRGPRSAE